jgi:tRNA (guanine37-N1)-methyltransferase
MGGSGRQKDRWRDFHPDRQKRSIKMGHPETMRFDLITIFPEFFASILSHGVLRRAISGGLVGVEVQDLRAFAHDRHRTVDDRPFGGGEGMVLKPEPLAEAVESLGIAGKAERGQGQSRESGREQVILLSAQGSRFSQAVARDLAGRGRVVLLCGRYEGVDERVSELLCDRELSVGDYVLSGGELAAAIVVDATARLLPGVLGNEASSEYESFGLADMGVGSGEDGQVLTGTGSGSGAGPGSGPRSTHGSGGLLDYPHYTRPAEFRGVAVPTVLTEGDHAAIRRWRRERALEKTWRNRPDLLEGAELSEGDRTFLRGLGWGS